MTYINLNANTAYIDGSRGINDGRIANPSVRYARNSVDNYKGYISDFKFEPVNLPDMKGLNQLSEDKFEAKIAELDSAVNKMAQQKMPPINFIHQYMPNQVHYRFVDKDALLAVAYEEMGKRTSVSTDEMTKNLQDTADLVCGKDKAPKMNAASLDLDGNGRIDLGEYSASILVEDAMSTNSNYFDSRNINGILTNHGENTLLRYGMAYNYDLAKTTFKTLHKAYGLDVAQQNFLSNPNNLV